jgi:SAM-dependent methyltransferase
MLAAARRAGIDPVVVGMLPQLPFADASFDLVLSAFVLTHVDDIPASVLDMRRVLRPGGRIGLSAWGAADDDLTRAWNDAMHEFVPAQRLAAAADRVLPGEAILSKPGGLETILARGGFDHVTAHARTLEFRMTVDDYVESRGVCACGRTLRALLGEPEWARCRQRARAVVASRFGDVVAYAREVYFAVARRPR